MERTTSEVFAASVVVWQLRGVSEDRERLALRLIGLSFFVLAGYVVVEAVRDLVVGAEADESVVGIVLASVSLAVMPALALAKRRTAKRMGSARVRRRSWGSAVWALLGPSKVPSWRGRSWSIKPTFTAPARRRDKGLASHNGSPPSPTKVVSGPLRVWPPIPITRA